MIRTMYYVPPIQQFRARVELVARRTRQALEQRRRALRSGAAFGKKTLEDNYFSLRWRQELRQTRAAFEQFFDRYDTLVGLLCLAAHEGWKPEHEEEYRTLRFWFQSHYPGLKPRVSPFLQEDESDRAPISRRRWARRQPRSCDAFEALYLPGSVAALLEHDNGDLIGRLSRTGEALSVWDRTLSREEAAVSLSRH